MRAGQLREKVVVQSAAKSVNSDGDAIKTWSTVATVRAEFRPLPSQERFSAAANRELSIETGKFLIRENSQIYSATGADGGTQVRLQWRGKNWNVLSIVHMRHERALELIAEVVA